MTRHQRTILNNTLGTVNDAASFVSRVEETEDHLSEIADDLHDACNLLEAASRRIGAAIQGAQKANNPAPTTPTDSQNRGDL